jgi:predicted dehydrogenase
MWYIEPPAPTTTAAKDGKAPATTASATLLSTGRGGRPLPVLLEKDLVTGKEGFIERELKFARQWLYKKGIMVPEEERNPVDIQLDEFCDCVRTGKHPKADLEVGLHDSMAVILANLSMDEGRRVYFNEIDKMGRGGEAKPAVKKA